MLTQETVQKLDALVQALDQGKLEDIVKKVQFVDALADKPATPGEFAKLLTELQTLRTEITTLNQNYMEIKYDMSVFAKGMRAIIELNKKLDYEKTNIESTCSKYGAY